MIMMYPNEYSIDFMILFYIRFTDLENIKTKKLQNINIINYFDYFFLIIVYFLHTYWRKLKLPLKF